ncbi:hypothetical protein Dimus_020931 [Dionaea muscipula]
MEGHQAEDVRMEITTRDRRRRNPRESSRKPRASAIYRRMMSVLIYPEICLVREVLYLPGGYRSSRSDDSAWSFLIFPEMKDSICPVVEEICPTNGPHRICLEIREIWPKILFPSDDGSSRRSWRGTFPTMVPTRCEEDPKTKSGLGRGLSGVGLEGREAFLVILCCVEEGLVGLVSEGSPMVADLPGTDDGFGGELSDVDGDDRHC